MRKACTEVEWFEDYEVGDEFLGEPVKFTEEEIMDFARRYDPQPFHTVSYTHLTLPTKRIV